MRLEPPVVIMSPSVPILVIMLLTVVYNESQYVAEYQDDYEKIIPKNTRPFELCDGSLKKKMCKTTNIWRELLKNADDLFDDVHDFSREYAHDDIEEEETQKIGQKRTFPFKFQNPELYDCRTANIPEGLGPDYYPSLIGNVTCDYAANETPQALKQWPAGWSCQPVEHKTIVLSKKIFDNVTKDMSENLKGCWLFRIPIRKARAPSKQVHDDTNDIAGSKKVCWKLEEKYIHVGCRLKFMGSG